MKKILTLLLVLLSLIGFSQSDLGITYLGNEGFLITSENRKVLIDALFYSSNYTAPTPEMLKQMIQNQPPFNDIDILFVTHAHRDHFTPDICLLFLQNQKNSKLVAPVQAVDQMKDLPGFNSVRPRVISVESEFGEHELIKAGPIKVDAFCLNHSPYWKDGVNRQAEIKNMAYIVELDGTRFYHSGDATFKGNLEAFQNYNFFDSPVDLMFLQRYDTSVETKSFVANTIKPDEIIAMHIKDDEISYWQDRFTKHFPLGRIFTKQGENYSFRNRVNFQILSGEYFGMKKPGAKPEVFAPGIVSTKNLEHSYPSFSPNGDEVVWSVVRRPKTSHPHVVLYTKEENGTWTWPQIISFSGEYLDDKPMFTPDGQYILFTSKRPIANEAEEEFKRLAYYSAKDSNGWSDPILVEKIKDDKLYKIFAMYGNTPIVKMDHALFRLNDVDVSALENKGSLNWTFNLSNDGRLALFSSNRTDENDYGDIYYSVNENGNWSEPVNLIVTNTKSQERFPGFSFDGEYFFFTRWTKENDQEVFWMKTPSELKIED